MQEPRWIQPVHRKFAWGPVHEVVWFGANDLFRLGGCLLILPGGLELLLRGETTAWLQLQVRGHVALPSPGAERPGRVMGSGE